MKTAVEWLIDQLTQVDYGCINKTYLQNDNSLSGYKLREIFEESKRRHKQDIIDAICQHDIINHCVFSEKGIEDSASKAENYYNKTFNK